MRWWTTAIVLALVGMLDHGRRDIEAAEKFQKLTGAQIRAKFAGMEMSDDVHWRDRYERNGTITSQSMGKNRFWQVARRKDEAPRRFRSGSRRLLRNLACGKESRVPASGF